MWCSRPSPRACGGAARGRGHARAGRYEGTGESKRVDRGGLYGYGGVGGKGSYTDARVDAAGLEAGS